eukprot:COSAG04_NODE_302_length_17393_cov_6.251417_10_plen_83_part_00
MSLLERCTRSVSSRHANSAECHQDNGGYLGNGGDDTPLRGGKFSDFQGGVRVAAFAAGGLLPPAVRGGEVDGYIHICAHPHP